MQEVRNLISPDQKKYLKKITEIEHTDSDPEDKKLEKQALLPNDPNFNLGPGLNLTSAGLNLLREAPSSDEDSPLKSMRP